MNNFVDFTVLYFKIILSKNNQRVINPQSVFLYYLSTLFFSWDGGGTLLQKSYKPSLLEATIHSVT